MITIRQGYRGMEVQTLRAALMAQGYQPTESVTDPNLFDEWVNAAVCAFQQRAGLTIDGIVGPTTWSALGVTSGTQPATQQAAGAAAAIPTTTPDPGKLAPGLPGDITPSGGSNSMLLLGIAGLVGFAWWYSKRKGGSFSGRPFAGDGDADDEAADADDAKEIARAKRKAKEIQKRILKEYQIELKRNEVDPQRQPGWANRIMRTVERSVMTDERLDMREGLKSERRSERSDFDPSVAPIPGENRDAEQVEARAAWLRQQDEIAKGRTAEERAKVAADIRRMRPELVGHKRNVSNPTYRQERATVGRKAQFSPVNPATGLRNRTESEVEQWATRVESARGAAQGTKKIQVSSRRYHTDKAYRESEQDDARAKADATGAEVQLVNERGVALFKYRPNVRNFKDVTSERLIAEVARDAKKGNCPKAVRNLFRVRPLATDKKTEALLNQAAKVVHTKCTAELNEDTESREEVREEVLGQKRAVLTKAQLIQEGLWSDKKKLPRMTVDAIRKAVKDGRIEKEEGRALIMHLRERNQRIIDERTPKYEPLTVSSRVIRKRGGELPALITTAGGRRRTVRIRD